MNYVGQVGSYQCSSPRCDTVQASSSIQGMGTDAFSALKIGRRMRPMFGHRTRVGLKDDQNGHPTFAGWLLYR